MKFRSLIAAGVLMFSASAVEAQSIEAVTMTSDPNDVVFTLRADKPLSTPSVRAYEGSVRVRFPDSSAPASITQPGDGAAIKLIDVRSGSHGSSVMRLEFGDSTKLSGEDVRIENRKTSVVVRIARDLLPPLREPKAAEPKKAEAPVAAAPVAAKPAAAAGAAEKPAVAVTAEKPAAKPAKAVPLDLNKKSAPEAKKPLAAAMASDSSPMPMLLAISAILGLAYVAMRVVMKKQAAAPKSAAPIEIVAQKRIGPRHQLLIVRAFGREHLLSVQGGNTTPIATSDELEDTFEEKLAAAARIEPAADLVKDVAITQRANEPTREIKPEVTAGGDMIRAALAQRLSAATKSARAADGASAKSSNKEDKALSQAVAGLVRLRREAQL
ncbi:MAG TPA: flagellar biosynthetic protein FliO [Polyangiales bacterium]